MGGSVPPRAWYPISGQVPNRRTALATAVMASKPVIDPLQGPKLALAGRVVTMDDSYRVHGHGIIYIENGAITAIKPPSATPPPGFAEIPIVDTKGTIYPGLIELHNHLSYNALPLWFPVPRKFEHRGLWPNHPDYRRLISGPMNVVGKTPELLSSLVRYVECKCLISGVTTTQGIKLSSNAGVQRYYRGIVRNVEQTDEPDLPEAQSRIPDIDAKSAVSFRNRLLKAQDRQCFLLHLSEGVTHPDKPDSIARRHFLALEVDPGEWAITDALAGIHSTGLLDADFDILAKKDASIVWSPLSNLLLYGETSRVEAARKAGVKVGLGSDWSPSGSKNLLGELKVAYLYSRHFLNGHFSSRDLVAMATRTAAEILKWEKHIGTLEQGKRADLFVVDGAQGNEYDHLIKAAETDIRLVMINGVARFGAPDLMEHLVPSDQTIRVGGEHRKLYLKQGTSDPDVSQKTLSHAKSELQDAFKRVATLAKRIETHLPRVARSADRSSPIVWSLALDEIQETGDSQRPRLPYSGPGDFTGPKQLSPKVAAGAPPLSKILGPIKLDPLAVADDSNFLDQVTQQTNVPPEIRKDLPGLF